jgi:tetratricopeptide (TPR) repeat protein
MPAPKNQLRLRVFLASPGDVAEERKAVMALMQTGLPKDPLLPCDVDFTVVAWDDPDAATPMPAHLTPQAAVTRFKGRPSDCDIVLVILRARIGTVLDVSKEQKHDGSAYRSGTEWEYEDAWNATPQPEIMIYRCSQDLNVKASDRDRQDKLNQWDGLQAFLARFQNPDKSWNGGINDFADAADFGKKLETYLKLVIVERAAALPDAAGDEPPAPHAIEKPFCLGRVTEAELLLTALLGPKDVTAIVLGPGGIGKTTLTTYVAADDRLAPRFGRRRWLVPLENAQDAATMRQNIVLALGLDPANPAAFDNALHELARAPGLLVLDNLETPWEAERTETETTLRRLAAIPGLSLLVSARGVTVPDHLTFTHRPVLEPLDDTAAQALFLEHAPSVAPDDPNLIPFLQALGGVPLAIYLVARLAAPFGDLAELWEEYQRRGPELARHAHLPEGRLTSVVRSLDLSWRSPRLHDPGRALFRLLGLSPAGLCRDDRRALLGDEARAAAEQVLEVGLAFLRAGRLDLLPPVRGYAQAEQKPTPAEEDRWCRHFLALAADEGEKVGAVGGGAAVARLGPEMPNVEAAFQASSEGERRATAAGAAYEFAKMVGFSGLGRPDPLRALAQACHAAGDKHGEANCIQGLGDIALARSDHDAARRAYEEARPLYRQVGAVLAEANCIKGLGDIALRRSDHDAARRAYEEARPLYRKVGAVLGEANCIRSLGDIALARSDHDAARRAYEEARPLYRQVGAVLGEANCIQGLGDIALACSDHDAAWAAYAEARPVYRQVGDVLGEANCIQSLGDIEKAKGQADAACALYEQALALYERIPEPYSIGVTQVRLAEATEGSVRAAHVAAARAAWTSIDRPDLVARLDQFG